MAFAIPVDDKLKIKESEKMDKNMDITRELKIYFKKWGWRW